MQPDAEPNRAPSPSTPAPSDLITKLRYHVIRWFWFIPDRLTDEQMARTPEWCFDAMNWIKLAVAKTLCAMVGHEPTCDQCCRPEHDYCLWCETLTPGKAHRP